jgi:hypothetical protein
VLFTAATRNAQKLRAMTFTKALGATCLGLAGLTACSGDPETEPVTAPKTEIASAKIYDLPKIVAKPEPYDWFDFRPNIQKLILAGVPESRHIAILWYTVDDGGVALHYHAKTESVYVIDGAQTDGKGTYDTGTVYFNPPGSGHQVTDSGGFFLLAYAAPPDFTATDKIEDYTPITIDTKDPDLTLSYDFAKQPSGAHVFEPALAADGGLSASFFELSGTDSYGFVGNYLLVLDGSCDVEGVTLPKQQLVVADGVDPLPYAVKASKGAKCLALGVSF